MCSSLETALPADFTGSLPSSAHKPSLLGSLLKTIDGKLEIFTGACAEGHFEARLMSFSPVVETGTQSIPMPNSAKCLNKRLHVGNAFWRLIFAQHEVDEFLRSSPGLAWQS